MLKGLSLYRLGFIQDCRTFLKENKNLTVKEIIALLDEDIAAKAPDPVEQKAKGKIHGGKPCPRCDVAMRKEHKGKESIWHCLICQYSEYIGVEYGPSRME